MMAHTINLPANCPLQQALAALSGGRILLALEGGYNTRVTSEAAAACLGVLLGAPPPPPDPFAAPRPPGGHPGRVAGCRPGAGAPLVRPRRSLSLQYTIVIDFSQYYVANLYFDMKSSTSGL